MIDREEFENLNAEGQEILRTLRALVFGEIESEPGRLKISKRFDTRFVPVLRIHRKIRVGTPSKSTGFKEKETRNPVLLEGVPDPRGVVWR